MAASATERYEEERKRRAEEAYHRWILKDKQHLELKRKDFERRKKRKELFREEKKQRENECMKEYEKWRKRKDAERHLQSSIRRDHVDTPTLPGYISVWSCDKTMADLVLRKVKRPKSSTLIGTDYDTSNIHNEYKIACSLYCSK